MLTRYRRGKGFGLCWRDIGADAISRSDGSKTGPRAVPLGETTRAHIDALPGTGKPDDILFPRYAKSRRQDNLITC